MCLPATGVCMGSYLVKADSACRLYFDIEFKKEPNPSVDGLALLDTFIRVLQYTQSTLPQFRVPHSRACISFPCPPQYTCYQLWMRYRLSCDRTNILDLDSSSPTKFSRHLVFHLPAAVFKNNIHAGKESLTTWTQGTIVTMCIVYIVTDVSDV